MQKTTFKIPKMDCPSEEKMVRFALEENKDIKHLAFDFSSRTLTVTHDSSSDLLLSALEPLNYGTKLLSTETAMEDEALEGTDSLAEAKVLKTLLLINGVMFLVELVTGLMADSVGLISDSLDMLADSSVYFISLYAVGKSLTVKKKSARLNGIFQVILSTIVLIETIRRFFFGSDPEPAFMTLISLIALCANVYCLYLLSGHKEKGVHMKASYICSSSDVMANMGVILAGGLVYITGSPYPDLVVGLVVTAIVLRGGISILRIAR